MIYDVIIIGLGASGVAASIYAKRSGLNVAVINYGTPGGIISTSSIVENYPGFKSITGMDLAIKYFEHFNSLDIPLFNEEVIDIKDGDIKKVITSKKEYSAKKIIICSGRKPRRLDIKDEEKYLGRGISYCTVCDGNLYKNKNTLVVGGGNSALESALYLSDICNNVYLLVRKSNIIGSISLVNQLKDKENVRIIYDSWLEELLVKDNNIYGVKTNKEELLVNGIFVNIGYEPSVSIFKSLNIEMEKNYIIVDKNMETSVKGIYAAGDIIKKDLYQLVTAVSEGAIAANSVYKSIKL